MSEMPRRPSVKIRFKYNVDTGKIEQLIVDDQAPERSEHYHDKVAEAVAMNLGRRPEIEDAGPRHLLRKEPVTLRALPEEETSEDEAEKETQAD